MRLKIILPVFALLFTIVSIKPIYGADKCTKLSILMYHHIQDTSEAVKKKQTGLSVSPEYFDKHIKYLIDNGYTFIGQNELVNYLDNGISLPKKSVMITLDDAYDDNYTKMFPILKKYNAKATIFTPTGLVQNPGYLTWDQINEMKNSGLVYFGNHTWSHHSASGTKEKQHMEIGLANKQLSEKGLNDLKIFAYPYGQSSKFAKEVLADLGYKAAITTRRGTTVCSSNRFEIPRIRVGNATLKSYGL